MRKSYVAFTAATIGIFGVGYAIGQVTGITSTSAASNVPAQSHGDANAFRYFAPFANGDQNFGNHDFRHSDAQGPGASSGPYADGVVTNVSGDTITIQADADRAGSTELQGVTTITLSSTTTYNAGYTGTATKASIVKGANIAATGTVSSDGKTLAAKEISVRGNGPDGGHGGHGGFGGHGQGGPHADGTVVSVSGDTVTVKADADTNQHGELTAVTTIQLTGTTTYGGGHDSTTTATRASIVAGKYIIAEGTVSSDGKTLTATNVEIQDSGSSGGFGGFH